ncbi:fumarylacetoacetate hydrolase family protein [Caenibius sp. WL]|uniref:fumarylacetoacetate hydrolase family protein n=1 Tax=Caenibius sp. WL TaxID=2872646 RepID=UPI001C99CE0E|nr:fumarylacetoacetate hydrolase family protein [Caenibius sp. WL]QZP07882.1 fumarylacetoacetate hydrolase family protein [Caenibius sp. WL]
MSKAELYGRELYEALRGRRSLTPLIERDSDLTVDDAYAISLDFLARRVKDGEKVVGKKIGVTSKAVQDMLGVHQPDFGFLTDWMFVEGDIDVDAKALIAPRAEAEIAFILKDSLNGPGVTAADVMAATESIAPCFEIVDSRINDWKISIVDTVSDNASCGVYVIGDARLDPREFDLPGLHVAVTKNGEPLSEGYGNAVQGDPAQAVAWLANTLGAYGVTLDAGDVILSGSLVPLAPAVKGDTFEMILSDKNPAEGGRALGNCVARFV